MNSFYFAMTLLILSYHVVTGCSNPPGKVLPGYPGTTGSAKPVRRRAIGDREKQKHEVTFSAFDTDNNGNIDACEWMEERKTSNVREFVKTLDAVDSNGDNVISAEEFQALKF